MGDPAGEADQGALRLDLDRRPLLEFRGSTITSDAGLLAYRELDNTLRLTNTGAETLADARTAKNGRDRLAGLLRQSVFARLAGYEDVNNAESCAATRRCAGWSATKHGEQDGRTYTGQNLLRRRHCDFNWRRNWLLCRSLDQASRKPTSGSG